MWLCVWTVPMLVTINNTGRIKNLWKSGLGNIETNMLNSVIYLFLPSINICACTIGILILAICVTVVINFCSFTGRLTFNQKTEVPLYHLLYQMDQFPWRYHITQIKKKLVCEVVFPWFAFLYWSFSLNSLQIHLGIRYTLPVVIKIYFCSKCIIMCIFACI